MKNEKLQWMTPQFKLPEYGQRCLGINMDNIYHYVHEVIYDKFDKN